MLAVVRDEPACRRFARHHQQLVALLRDGVRLRRAACAKCRVRVIDNACVVQRDVLVCRQFADRGRKQQRVFSGDQPDGADDLVGAGALEQESRGSDAQCLEDVVVLLDVVSTRMRGGSSTLANRRRVATMPSTTGMRTSINTTCGRRRRTSAATPAPSSTSPIRSRSGSALMIAHRPLRIGGSSSTSTTARVMESDAAAGARTRTSAPRRGRRTSGREGW